MFDVSGRRLKKAFGFGPSFLDTIAIREGILFKQAGTAPSKWQSRYVVLRRGFLDYYASQQAWIEKKPKGVLTLLDAKIELVSETESGKPFTLAFSHASSKRVYMFMAASREEQSAWLDTIRVEMAKTKKRANTLSLEIPASEKEGYLFTQTPKQPKWDTKYIVIRGGVLEYYEEQTHWHEKKQPRSTLILFSSQVVRVNEQDSGKPFSFHLMLSSSPLTPNSSNNPTDRVYPFACFGPDEQTEWINALEQEIDRSSQRQQLKKEEGGGSELSLSGIRISEQEIKIQLENLQQTMTELAEALDTKTEDEKSRELCERSIEEVKEEINVLLSIQRDVFEGGNGGAMAGGLNQIIEKQKKDSFVMTEPVVSCRKDVMSVLSSVSRQLSKLPVESEEEPPFRDSLELLDQIVSILEGGPKREKGVFNAYLDYRAKKLVVSPRPLTGLPPTPTHQRHTIQSAQLPKTTSKYGTLTTDSRGWFAQKLASSKPGRTLRETLRTRAEKKDDAKTLRPKLQTFDVDLSQLKIGAVLGSGATGVVYSATYYDQTVAVKKLHPHIATEPDVVDSFVQEAEIWKPLTFRSILQLYGVCLEPGNVCLVMEMGAMSLADLLYKEALYPDLPWARRLTIAKEIAAALLYMHSKGVVHRDIKSMNILLTSDHATKICDFGMARLLEDLEHDPEHATSPERAERTPEVITGTPQWLAPEVGEGEVYSKAADVFSFGVVLWEIAARQLPYAEDNIINPSLFMAQISKGLRPPLGSIQAAANLEVSDRFMALVVRCWHPSAGQRPSFDLILAELSAILDLETKRDRFKEKEAELSLEKGKDAFERKDYEATQRLLQYSIQCAPSPEAYVHLWLCFMTVNQSDEALATCSNWIKDFPKSMAAYMKRGDTYMFLKKFTDALSAYNTALSFDPYHGGLAIKIKAAKKNMALALDLSTAAILTKKMVRRSQIPPPPKRAPPPRPNLPSSTGGSVLSDTGEFSSHTDIRPPRTHNFDVLSSPAPTRSGAKTPPARSHDSATPPLRKTRSSDDLMIVSNAVVSEPTSHSAESSPTAKQAFSNSVETFLTNRFPNLTEISNPSSAPSNLDFSACTSTSEDVPTLLIDIQTPPTEFIAAKKNSLKPAAAPSRAPPIKPPVFNKSTSNG